MPDRKILSLIPYPYLPVSSGGQKSLALFNAYLGEKAVLHVAGTSDNEASLAKNYAFHPVLGRTRFRYINPLLPAKIIRLIQQYQITTLILEHPYMGWIIPFVRLCTKAEIICRTQNIESERFKSIGKKWWWLLAKYERWVLRRCDHVLCITEADLSYMIKRIHIPVSQCSVAPFGIERRTSPHNKAASKERICQKHGLNPDLPLLFFNGLLSYKPNADALDMILHKIHPLLEGKKFRCNILIVGKGLSDSYHGLKAYESKGIFYVGFVDDIDPYYEAADLLLNPVITGGGIKTKLIEALGSGTSVVSTESGATGVDPAWTGHKLWISRDEDTLTFTNHIAEAMQTAHQPTPEAFYRYFYWGHIIDRVLQLHTSHHTLP